MQVDMKFYQGQGLKRWIYDSPVSLLWIQRWEPPWRVLILTPSSVRSQAERDLK